MKHAPALAALLALAACDGRGPAENTAGQLEDAAGQSTPAAADVLENAAGRLEEGEVGDPNAAAQEALNQAGNADAPGPAPGTSQPVDNLLNGY